MRYVVYGSGAVGSVIGARLFQAEKDVVLIARGAHHDAILRDGLRFRAPNEDLRLRVPVVTHPREIDFRDDDVVLLTMKTQDTEPALRDLERAAGARCAVVSCQNGVENERLIARRFERAYAMLCWLPATFLEPGTVSGEGAPLSAILPVGRYPGGVDDVAERIAADVSGAQMFGVARPDVMKLKYAKLLFNLGNGVQAISGEYEADDAGRHVSALLKEEALACYRTAGIAWASDDEYQALMAKSGTAPVDGQARSGGSTWQSLMRGGSVEVDYLNGEIALLGRLFGVPTPANDVVRALCNQMAAAGERPGRYTSTELLARIERASTAAK